MTESSSPCALRIVSIDALRGLVMFTMIFVNDLAGAPKGMVPAWMEHYHGKSGMTFVDLVFPAFLFVMGMSVPIALGSRLRKGQSMWRVAGHVMARTAALLFIGILMVNETPDTKMMGWSGTWWCVALYAAAIAAFCTVPSRAVTLTLRLAGYAVMTWLALEFRGKDGHQIITFSPLQIATDWYGILGLIGWAYLMTALVYLAFRTQRTALLGCMTLLMSFYAADHTGVFGDFWLGKIVNIGEALGSHAAISVGGLLLATVVIGEDKLDLRARARFTLWFVLICAAAAILLNGLYGINKNEATPSWCLWACAVTAVLWFICHLVTDVRPVAFIARPLAACGSGVLLAYLLSEFFPPLRDALHFDDWYDGLATSLPAIVLRSAGCSIFLLAITSGLSRLGFMVRI